MPKSLKQPNLFGLNKTNRGYSKEATLDKNHYQWLAK